MLLWRRQTCSIHSRAAHKVLALGLTISLFVLNPPGLFVMLISFMEGMS